MLRTSIRVAKANSQARPRLARLLELLGAGWGAWLLSTALLALLVFTATSQFYPVETWYWEELLLQEIRLTLRSTAPLFALIAALFLHACLIIRKLEEQLVRAHLFLETAERNADTRTFEFVPGVRQFRDALAMEYRRASASDCRLSMVLFSAGSPSLEVMGKIVQLLHFTLEPGYSIGRISTTTIAVLLPETTLEQARVLAGRVEEHIGTFAPGVEVYSTVAAYPQQAACLAELEAPIRRLVSDTANSAALRGRLSVVRATAR